MKLASKYIKLYDEAVEEHFKVFGEYFPYRTWDEVYADQRYTFDKYLKGRGLSEKTVSSYVKILADALDGFGYYLAFQQQDCKTLNNVLYQTSRRRLLSGGMTAGGVDHGCFYNSLLTAFACNDFAVFERFFPNNFPFVKSRFYIAPAMNLLKIMYYQEDEQKQMVLDQAEKFLDKKSAILDKAVIHYLIALIRRDASAASDALEQACIGWQRSGLLGKSDKCFAEEVHGLYRFARHVDKSFFESVTQPAHPSFSKEFEAWQKENDYPKGEIYYQFPIEMDWMNVIYAADLPEVSLIEYKKNKFYTDNDKFLRDLTSTVMALNER